jgi:hypothetical protein
MRSERALFHDAKQLFAAVFVPGVERNAVDPARHGAEVDPARPVETLRAPRFVRPQGRARERDVRLRFALFATTQGRLGEHVTRGRRYAVASLRPRSSSADSAEYAGFAPIGTTSASVTSSGASGA